jgi:hypothetical protein
MEKIKNKPPAALLLRIKFKEKIFAENCTWCFSLCID